MPGVLSSLIHSATTGLESYQGGQDDATRALLSRLDAEEKKKLQQAQIDRLNSQTEAERYATEHPKQEPYRPSTREEAVGFYKDTHPERESGPTPGSEEWYNMQDRVARIRASHRAGSEAGGNRELLPYDKEITTVGQQIDDNRMNLNVHDRDFKQQYPEGAPTRRPKNEKMVPSFISDSTQAQGMLGQRRQLMQRDSTLNANRDELQAIRRKKMGLELGMSPTKPTAGAGSDTGYTNSGVPPEAQSLFDEAAAAYQANPTPENQQKYNRAVAAISRKYGLIK